MNTIDGINLANYGIFITRGGDDTFLQFPTRKEPPQNSWFEEDGLDVELSSPLFSPLSVSLGIHLLANSTTAFNSYLNSLETLLNASGTRSIFIGDLDKTYTARFTGITNYEHRGGVYRTGDKRATMDLNFILDNPTQVFTPNELTLSGGRTPTHIKLNGVDLGDFGIIVKNLYNTALPSGAPKMGIVNTYNHLSGAVADTGFAPKESSKQIALMATLVADTRAIFWQNYTALFNHLRQDEALTIELADGRLYECYYQTMPTITKVRPISKDPRVSFTLQLKTI